MGKSRVHGELLNWAKIRWLGPKQNYCVRETPGETR